MRRILPLLIVLLLPAVSRAAPPAKPNTPVKAAKTAAATPPQSILDALAKVEQDRQDGAAADAAIAIAQASLDAGVKAKAAAAAAMAADQAAFLKLWAELYGPMPPVPPTPTPPPVPPPTPPTPPPVVVAAMVVITDKPTTSGSWTTPAVEQYRVAHDIKGYAYSVSSVADPDYQDSTALSYIGWSAGHDHPYGFLLDGASPAKILWQGAVPKSDAEWLALLGKYAGTPGCKDGSCPVMKGGRR